MTTTPDVRQGTRDGCPGVYRYQPVRPAAPPPALATVARTVTLGQVEQAIVQLRERRGRPAAEQLQAVLRALDLTVAPRDE